MGELGRGRSGGVESLTLSLVSTIAEREGIDPVELTPPISAIVDVDALEELLFGDGDGFVEVEFTYRGYRITIGGGADPRIEVE